MKGYQIARISVCQVTNIVHYVLYICKSIPSGCVVELRLKQILYKLELIVPNKTEMFVKLMFVVPSKKETFDKLVFVLCNKTEMFDKLVFVIPNKKETFDKLMFVLPYNKLKQLIN